MGLLSPLRSANATSVQKSRVLDVRCISAETPSTTLKRFVRVEERHVELRPDSHSPEHEPIAIDLAKQILHIDGVAVGALIGRLGSVGQ